MADNGHLDYAVAYHEACAELESARADRDRAQVERDIALSEALANRRLLGEVVNHLAPLGWLTLPPVDEHAEMFEYRVEEWTGRDGYRYVRVGVFARPTAALSAPEEGSNDA